MIKIDCGFIRLVIRGLLFGIILVSPVQAQTDVDSVLAVVNGDVITTSEFEIRLRQTISEMRLRQTAPNINDAFKRRLLDRMVTERIQLQLAERLRLHIDDAMVDNAINRLAGQNNLSLAKFKQVIRSSGSSYNHFRNRIRDQLKIHQVVELRVTNRTVVTDSEVDAFLASQGYLAGSELQEFNLSHILLRLPVGAAPEQIAESENRLAGIQQQLVAGKLSFSNASKQYSQAQDAKQSGLLGWRKLKQLPVVFTDAIKHLKVGEVSEVIRSPNGFHLLKLNGLRGQPVGNITETHVRHLLIKSGPFLSTNEARARAEQLRTRLVGGDDFSVLARASSDDPLSSNKGGDLGWTAPGTLVKPFEDAMNRLKPNEISPIVTTPYGHHIIQVLARRQRSASEHDTRSTARARVRSKKAEQAFEGWIRRLRDESYIEYRTG